MKITSYNIKNSVPYEVQFEKDGVAIDTAYEADELMTDSTKGLAQITVRDATGAIANDADGNALEQVNMFRHPTDSSKAVFSITAGFADAGDYLYEIWGVIPVDGKDLKVSVFGTTRILSHDYETEPPA